MTKAVLPYFRERRAGHIIQVTSIAGRIGPAGRAPYAAAKFGVEGFSESLLKEIGPLGIKVTIIEPGGFRTDFAGSSTQLRLVSALLMRAAISQLWLLRKDDHVN